MRRCSPLLAYALVALALVPASSAKPTASWALPQIEAVVAAGVMGSDVATFHPNDPLTRVTLEQLVAGLTHSAPLVSANPTARVTMAGLDGRLVGALGLSETAIPLSEVTANTVLFHHRRLSVNRQGLGVL